MVIKYIIVRIILISSFIIIIKVCFKCNLFNYIKETIFENRKFDDYIEAFNKAKDFINNNMKGILINKQEIRLYKKPKISVVIPCYNCKDFILRTIRSIQNQNFSSFEIIIVNDFSIDNSSLFLNQLQNEDKRIKVINNAKNMGILYSRSIGALSSKGKYIFPIDNDDMLLYKDVFSIVTNIADLDNLDITIFNSIKTSLKPNVYSTKISKVEFESNHKSNLILYQPELGYYQISPSTDLEKLEFNEELIHGKCIKTKIYKRALNKLGKERFSRHMILGEDDLANNIIFNTGKKAKFIQKYGYIYIERPDSSAKMQKDIIMPLINYIYILDVMIDFTKELPRNTKVLVNYIIFLFNKEYLKEAINRNKYINKLFISCLERILNCKYISNNYKKEIRKRGKSLNFINYNF